MENKNTIEKFTEWVNSAVKIFIEDIGRSLEFELTNADVTVGTFGANYIDEYGEEQLVSCELHDSVVSEDENNNTFVLEYEGEKFRLRRMVKQALYVVTINFSRGFYTTVCIGLEDAINSAHMLLIEEAEAADDCGNFGYGEYEIHGNGIVALIENAKKHFLTKKFFEQRIDSASIQIQQITEDIQLKIREAAESGTI